ncbi:MAG: hypothetical protein AB7R90_02710 [Reyranellaceae bacterium]
MLDLLPLPQDRLACPCGTAELAVHGFVMPGMFLFARTSCPGCGRRFLSRLHVDFVFSAEFHFNLDNGEVFSTAPDWYHGQLMSSLASRERVAPPLEKLARRPLGADVMVLNAIDPVYGHCLHKLFSYSASKSLPGVSFLAVVPSFLKWMVPETIDEVWIVNEPRGHMSRWNPHVLNDMAQLAGRCQRLRYHDLSWLHTVEIQDYTRVAPRKAGIAPTRLLINWREDRCWTLRGRPLPAASAVAEQLRLYTLLLETLRQHAPDLEAYVTGYGDYGDFPGWVRDLRIVEHDAAAEQAWVRIAGKCHAALGVHGSNMILPAAHAESAIEIVPRNKWTTVMVTWDFANTMRPTDALGRFRLVPDSSSVSDIAWLTLVQMRIQQNRALHHAARQAPTPQESLMLLAAHDDARIPAKPIACHGEDGEPL